RAFAHPTAQTRFDFITRSPAYADDDDREYGNRQVSPAMTAIAAARYAEPFMPQSSVFLPARRGTYVAVGRWAGGDVGYEWGRIGSVGGPRDSVRNRRDVFEFRPEIGRDAGRSGGYRIARFGYFRVRDDPPGHFPGPRAAGISAPDQPRGTGKPGAAGRLRCRSRSVRHAGLP